MTQTARAFPAILTALTVAMIAQTKTIPFDPPRNITVSPPAMSAAPAYRRAITAKEATSSAHCSDRDATGQLNYAQESGITLREFEAVKQATRSFGVKTDNMATDLCGISALKRVFEAAELESDDFVTFAAILDLPHKSVAGDAAAVKQMSTVDFYIAIIKGLAKLGAPG
jgi:hypothetical protein